MIVAAGGGDNGMQVVFKNCVLFTKCITEIKNKQIDNTKDIDVIMPTYNLIENSDNYSKTLESLWQYCRDEPALTDVGTLASFSGNSVLFKFKQQITGSKENDRTTIVKTMIPLKY